MSLETIVGAACVWVGLSAMALFALRVAIGLWAWLESLLRIQVFAWRIKGWGYITQEELNDFLDCRVRRWVMHHERDNAWCRDEDYRDGVNNAAKHLLRDMNVHIMKRRKK
jgi:hypothetical protein